jgi:hypothetical protein
MFQQFRKENMSRLNGKKPSGHVVAILLGLSILYSEASTAQTIHYPKGAPELPKWSELGDWTGVWERDGDNVWDNRIPPGIPQDPPYTDAYKKLAAVGPAGQRGAPFNSMPGWMNMLFPMDVQVTRSQVTLMSENKNQPRRIYTDGRAPSENTLPSTLGYSTGQWKNGELIVKTCCVRADTRLPGIGPGGGPHSDQLEFEERFYLRDSKTLVDEVTVKDPKAFVKIWTTEKIWYRRPNWEPVEYDRTENDRDAPGAAR